MSSRSEEKRLRLESAATAVSSSFDATPARMGVGSAGQIALSKPLRYSSTSLERLPSPAFVFPRGCCQVDKLVK